MALRQSFRTNRSRFKHVFGSPAKKEFCYEGIRITEKSWESNFCAVNPKFLAVVLEAQGGGPFLVLPLETVGRIPSDYPKVCGHQRPVLDLQWNPFDDNILVSASEDTTIKVWFIPDGGLHEDLKDYEADLRQHEKKVGIVRWHPCASNILASAGFDNLVIIWDVFRQSAIYILKGHPDTIHSLCFNWNGSRIATTCKDKMIRVLDPRAGKQIYKGQGHRGPKGMQVSFLGNTNKLFTTGFSVGNHREIAVWDLSEGLKRPQRIEQIDESSGLLMLHFDPDTRVVYLAGKGDGNIRYYEIIDEEPYLVFLNEYRSSTPQRGLGSMPKRGLEIEKCEVMRFYKLHSTGMIEPVSMIVPRRDSAFQGDLYPDTAANRPAMSENEWIEGITKEPLMQKLVPTDPMEAPIHQENRSVEYREPQLYNDVSHQQQHQKQGLVNGDRKVHLPKPSNDYKTWDIETLRVAYADLQEEVHSLRMEVQLRDRKMASLESYYKQKFGF